MQQWNGTRVTPSVEMDDSIWLRVACGRELINTGPLFPVEMFRALPLIDFPRIYRLCVCAGERKRIWEFIGQETRADCWAMRYPKLFKRAATAPTGN